MQATTGGSDITAIDARRAAEPRDQARHQRRPRLGARLPDRPEYWQSQQRHARRTQARRAYANGGNRIDQIQDYGIEVGGPIVKDQLWAWGAYGRNQIDLVHLNGSHGQDDARRQERQDERPDPRRRTALTASYTAGDKIKIGRNVGMTRPPRDGMEPVGHRLQPSELDKIEASQVISSNFFLTASYSYFRGGFQLAPQAGIDGQQRLSRRESACGTTAITCTRRTGRSTRPAQRLLLLQHRAASGRS